MSGYKDVLANQETGSASYELPSSSGRPSPKQAKELRR